MISCRVVSRNVDAHVDGELDTTTQVEFDSHLASCPHCREEAALTRAVKAETKRALGGTRAPDALRKKLLAALAHVPDAARAARFRCAIVVVHGARPGHPVVVQGSCEGSITRALRGAGGFGYDPVFELARAELESLGRSTRDRLTMAELDEGEKNLVSHRGRAVRALRARWGELEVLGRGGQ